MSSLKKQLNLNKKMINNKLQEHQIVLRVIAGKGKKKRGGVKYPFPIRLHELLQAAEKCQALACVVSWIEDGTSFRVHDKKAFEREIQPTYFNQSKYASFRCQLDLWAFDRIEKYRYGGREGFYAHPLFKRDDPQLCYLMERSNHTHEILDFLVS